MTTPVFDKSSNTGLRHFVNATRFSLHGFRAAFCHEAAFRQETTGLLIAIPGAWWLGEGPSQIALLIAAYLMVMVVELLNSSIEAAVDHTSMEHHDLAARAKDLGSASVFLVLVVCGLIWAAVAYERFT